MTFASALNRRSERLGLFCQGLGTGLLFLGLLHITMTEAEVYELGRAWAEAHVWTGVALLMAGALLKGWQEDPEAEDRATWLARARFVPDLKSRRLTGLCLAVGGLGAAAVGLLGATNAFVLLNGWLMNLLMIVLALAFAGTLIVGVVSVERQLEARRSGSQLTSSPRRGSTCEP